MSSTEWMCKNCGYGPMSCANDKLCLVCQDPQLSGDCGVPSGLPRHPPKPGVNVSRGIAVGRMPHTKRGGRRYKRKNKTRRKHI
jgi:hypothetical protein